MSDISHLSSEVTFLILITSCLTGFFGSDNVCILMTALKAHFSFRIFKGVNYIHEYFACIFLALRNVSSLAKWPQMHL